MCVLRTGGVDGSTPGGDAGTASSSSSSSGASGSSGGGRDASRVDLDAGDTSDGAGGMDAAALDAAGMPDAAAGTPDAAVALDAGCPAENQTGYLDEDGDGVGAGALLCLPAGDGAVVLVPTGTDCAPQDGTLFDLRQVFPDLDGDAITVAAVTRCVGASPPANHFFEARPAGVLGVFGDVRNVAGPGVTWVNPNNATFANDNPAECPLTSDTACDALEADGFNYVGTPPANAGGLRVMVRLRPESGAMDVNITVQLRSGNMTLASLMRSGVTIQGNGSNGYTWVGFGQPGEMWGLTTLPDPATLTLRVLVSTASPVTRTIRADGISVMYFPAAGAEDCNDTDPLRWALSPGFTDADEDLHGLDATMACIGPTVPAGFTWRAGDCADNDSRAHPGAAPQTTQITGGMGWDFDCDGAVEPASFATNASCSMPVDPDGGVTACMATSTNVNPPESQCGTTRNITVCDTATCMQNPDTTVVACR